MNQENLDIKTQIESLRNKFFLNDKVFFFLKSKGKDLKLSAVIQSIFWNNEKIMYEVYVTSREVGYKNCLFNASQESLSERY